MRPHLCTDTTSALSAGPRHPQPPAEPLTDSGPGQAEVNAAWMHACLVTSVASDSLRPHGVYVAHQAPLSVGFPRQEYWRRVPFPPPGELPDLGIKLSSLMSPALADGFFTTSTTCKDHCNVNNKASCQKKWFLSLSFSRRQTDAQAACRGRGSRADECSSPRSVKGTATGPRGGAGGALHAAGTHGCSTALPGQTQLTPEPRPRGPSTGDSPQMG